MRKYRTFCADFETTVYKGQVATEVWASASVELYTEDVKIFHSIADQMNYFISLNSNLVVYFHNLKFDGHFILYYFMEVLKYDMAINKTETEDSINAEWIEDRYMENRTFKCSISNMGQWYTIKLKINNNFIEFRDSLKLLPFSVDRIGKSFGTKHKKLTMEYEGFRYAGCEITDEEKEYISNDILVVKEALEVMFNEGHNKLTIGSCCLSEYKTICKSSLINALSYDEMYPDLYSIELNKDEYGFPNAGEYIRKSYGGGWCYLVHGKENKIYHKGTTADVNSLYPSMMHSQSGNRYPIGKPCFWKGNLIPDKAIGENKYYFIRVKTRFYIKENMLPFIHIKCNPLYNSTENLMSSDVYNTNTGMYHESYYDMDGNLKDTRHIFVLTMTDYELIKEHYELVDFEILDGCWFYSEIGIFDEYIDKYAKIKKESKGAKRELAKLFLNNLYGKMASNTDSSFKLPFIKEDKTMAFHYISEHNKKAGYIPVGSAITSYARNFTIRAAQKNFHGVDKAGFIYADTDSIHCDLSPEQIVGIKVHDKDFCCWKLESCWDEAIFTRQKTYIEHVTHEDLEPIEEPYYNIKCAGMPKKCKDLFELSMKGTADINDNYTDEEKEFLFKDGEPIERTLNDFKIGLKVPDKLMPKRIIGGVLLVNTTYEMR